MSMLRHYYISDSLDELEVFEEQLEAAGITTPQIHVLSQDDDQVAKHEHLHGVQSFMKKDIIRSGERGALLGFLLSTSFLLISYYMGWTESAVGWLPFAMLAIVIFGFCTWEGGLLGIHKPNHHFERFQEALMNNKHVFFVDLDASQEATLDKVFSKHPKVKAAGTGVATPAWIISMQNKVPKFFRESFP